MTLLWSNQTASSYFSDLPVVRIKKKKKSPTRPHKTWLLLHCSASQLYPHEPSFWLLERSSISSATGSWSTLPLLTASHTLPHPLSYLASFFPGLHIFLDGGDFPKSPGPPFSPSSSAPTMPDTYRACAVLPQPSPPWAFLSALWFCLSRHVDMPQTQSPYPFLPRAQIFT